MQSAPQGRSRHGAADRLNKGPLDVVMRDQWAASDDGRGIGMGRAECEARSGKMELLSSEGAGTRVVFSFPESAMPRARAPAL